MQRLIPVVPALLALALGGCRTMIPATDGTPPRLELTITGPGIGRQTMTNPPRAQWSGSGGAQIFDLAPRCLRVVIACNGIMSPVAGKASLASAAAP